MHSITLLKTLSRFIRIFRKVAYLEISTIFLSARDADLLCTCSKATKLTPEQISERCFENLGEFPVRELYVIEFLLSKMQAYNLQPLVFRVSKILQNS